MIQFKLGFIRVLLSLTLVLLLCSTSVSPVLAAVSTDDISGTPQLLSGSGGQLQFTSNGHVLLFDEESVTIAGGSYMLRTAFAGANRVAPQSDGATAEEGGSDAAPPLSRVTYPGLWNGVTLVYDAVEEGIAKSTYYVEAADIDRSVASIRLRYNRPIGLDRDGNLLIEFDTGTMVDSAPIAWQETEEGRNPVEVSYVLHGDRDLGFSLGDYLPGVPVVIDPWLTFLGGSGEDYGLSIAVDGSGNVYVTGYSTAAWGSPVQAYTSGWDAFAAKLNSSGELQWNTFLGGSGADVGRGIAVDGSGNVYVTGNSNATWGSPVQAYTSGNDAFVAKLNSSGVLQWNTFLGGSGTDYGYGIAVDGSGNVYVTGYSGATWGSPVQAHAGSNDAFAAKLDSDGELLWLTFLGGSGSDVGWGIAVDGSGNVYVTGYSNVTWGSPVRAHAGGNDAFAAKLDSSGALQWHTFLGGSGDDYGQGIAVDGSGNVYVTGISWVTWGSPVQAHAGGNDAFAAKLDSSGALQWNTFLGGSGDDYGWGIAVDGSGNVYVTGYSDATWGSPVQAHAVGNDAFAAKLNSDGALQWNTFLGGSGEDYGRGIAVDSSGNVYVTGYSTDTWGSPVQAHAGGNDAFTVKLDSSGSLLVTYTVTYNANSATGGTAPGDQTKTHDVDLTLATNSGSLVRTGYTFAGWNTAADGSGTGYAAGGSYTANEAATLYAKWTANTYTVTFNANGGTSPVPGSKDVTFDAAYGDLATTGRTGYDFAGWYTAAEGGTLVTAATTVSNASSHTLHAQWTIKTYTVTYNANSATGGTAPGDQTKTHDVTLTLATNSGSLVRTGYDFAGWNSAADGSGTGYAAGTLYAANAAVTLYAKWMANTYMVIYSANGATGGTTPGDQTKILGVTLTLATNSGNLVRTGYIFAGWNTAADGSGTGYAAGGSYTANEAVTLYAKWTAKTPNGVSCGPSSGASSMADIVLSWTVLGLVGVSGIYIEKRRGKK